METTIVGLLGAIAPLLAAIVIRPSWTGRQRQWAALAVAGSLFAIAWAASRFAGFEHLAIRELAALVGAMQISYAVLKGTKVLDFLAPKEVEEGK